MIQLVFRTGIRTFELSAVRCGDFDWRQRVISIRRAKVRGEINSRKTKAGRREVKLPPAVEALKGHKSFIYVAGQEVFHNPRTGVPWAGDAPMRKTAWTQSPASGESPPQSPVSN